MNQNCSNGFLTIDGPIISALSHIIFNLLNILKVHYTYASSYNRPVRCSILLLTTAYDKSLQGLKFLNAITAGYSTI